MNRKIGISLPHCIADICEGKVVIDDVVMVVSATVCTTEEDWLLLYEIYAPRYWSEYKERALQVLIELYQKDKIHQPNHYVYSFFKELSIHHWLGANVNVAASILKQLMERKHNVTVAYQKSILTFQDAQAIIKAYKTEIDNILHLIISI